MCSKEEYMPVCGSDDITYQSPCFAGCDVTFLGKNKVSAKFNKKEYYFFIANIISNSKLIKQDKVN